MYVEKERTTDKSKDKDMSKDLLKSIQELTGRESILKDLFGLRMNNAIEEAAKRDKVYQEIDKKVCRKIDKLDKIKFNSEQWKLVDDALSGSNEISFEYGRVAYCQGFKDAVSLLAEIHFSS